MGFTLNWQTNLWTHTISSLMISIPARVPSTSATKACRGHSACVQGDMRQDGANGSGAAVNARARACADHVGLLVEEEIQIPQQGNSSPPHAAHQLGKAVPVGLQRRSHVDAPASTPAAR